MIYLDKSKLLVIICTLGISIFFSCKRLNNGPDSSKVKGAIGPQHSKQGDNVGLTDAEVCETKAKGHFIDGNCYCSSDRGFGVAILSNWRFMECGIQRQTNNFKLDVAVYFQYAKANCRPAAPENKIIVAESYTFSETRFSEVIGSLAPEKFSQLGSRPDLPQIGRVDSVICEDRFKKESTEETLPIQNMIIQASISNIGNDGYVCYYAHISEDTDVGKTDEEKTDEEKTKVVWPRSFFELKNSLCKPSYIPSIQKM